MGDPSDSERVAFQVVRRVLGAEVVHHDTEGRQGAVDALIHYGNGSQPAALEVTTLTDQSAYEVETLLAAEDFKWDLPGCKWWWAVEVPPRTSLRVVREALPRLALWCERHGVRDPGIRAHVYGLPGSDEWTRWLSATGVSVYGQPGGTQVGTAMVVPSGKGGAAGDLMAVPGWLGEELGSRRSRRKVEKLHASGYEERHLFLIVDDTGAPFAGFYAMAFGDGLPDEAPDTAGLTCIWLAPRWSPTVLRYDARAGWSRHQPYDDSATG